MYSEQPVNDFYEREGKEPLLYDIYDYNALMADLKKRRMKKAIEIIGECFKSGKSLKDVFEALGEGEETRGDIQEIRTVFKRHKVERNVEDKNS